MAFSILSMHGVFLLLTECTMLCGISFVCLQKLTSVKNTVAIIFKPDLKVDYGVPEKYANRLRHRNTVLSL